MSDMAQMEWRLDNIAQSLNELTGHIGRIADKIDEAWAESKEEDARQAKETEGDSQWFARWIVESTEPGIDVAQEQIFDNENAARYYIANNTHLRHTLHVQEYRTTTWKREAVL